MKILKNILKVVFGNMTAIISGVFVGFVLPKIISVSDYGFYKIFTLYFSYIGVLSMGIIDGIVLKYGKYNYEELDRKSFRSYFAWYALINFFFSVILFVIAVCAKDIDYQFVLLMLCANILPVNYTGYFQQISQITQRFKEYSIRKAVHSAANVIFIVIIFAMYKWGGVYMTYNIYLLGMLLINVALSFWYMHTYRDIIFGDHNSLRYTFKEILSLMKLGMPLLLANLCSTFLISLDRQFVSMLFTTEEYAVYAFAYSMLSLITVATSAVATVLYPVFKRMDEKLLRENYSNMTAVTLVFSFAVILVYYPLCYFINWFLPSYEYSLLIFRIILPGLVMSTVLTVVMHNYYKVLGLSASFFKKSIIALIVAFLANLVAFLIFKSRESISIASILAFVFWYLMTELPLRKTCKVNIKNFLFLTVMCACFYLCTITNIYWLGGIINLGTFVGGSILFYGKDIKSIIKLVKKQ